MKTYGNTTPIIEVKEEEKAYEQTPAFKNIFAKNGIK
jgi:hypothetical protein